MLHRSNVEDAYGPTWEEVFGRMVAVEFADEKSAAPSKDAMKQPTPEERRALEIKALRRETKGSKFVAK